MIRFLYKVSESIFKQRHFGPLILNVSAYSTQTQVISFDSLHRRLQILNLQKVSVIPALEEWISEGRQIHDQELKRLIINFRRNRRFKPALEIAEWMNHSMKQFAITSGHVAVHLDLISKVHGVEQAEKYFNSLDKKFKDLPVYAALLNCYAYGKSLDKAEAAMEEIRLLNSRSTLVYNTMLGLYSHMGMRETLFSLMREMEGKGIEFNEVTYNIKLNAYAESDVKKMEMLLLKMEVDPVVKVDFLSYVTAAKGYLKAGASEKASMVLKKAENLIKGPRRQFAYGTLMTFFAAMQNKEEVHRLVSIIRCCGNLSYGSCVYIFTSLEKLNDLDSAKKILIEWEEKNAYFDIRIPNLVISAYCKKGYVGEAEVILKRMIESGREPSAKTWSLMALGYYKSDQMAKAVDATKKAFEASFPGWKPDLTTVAACIDYLKKIGDSDGIQEMVMLLEKYGSFSVEFKERLGSYVSMGSQRT